MPRAPWLGGAGLPRARGRPQRFIGPRAHQDDVGPDDTSDEGLADSPLAGPPSFTDPTHGAHGPIETIEPATGERLR